jgi:heme exporter protein CcmD
MNPKYALFIWTSYGLALAVVLWNVLVPSLKRGELKKRLSEVEDRAGEEE